MSVIMANQTGHEERQETPFWVREAIPRPPPAGRATGQHGGGVGGVDGRVPVPKAKRSRGNGRPRAGPRGKARTRDARSQSPAAWPACGPSRGFPTAGLPLPSPPWLEGLRLWRDTPRPCPPAWPGGPTSARPPDALRAAACTRCASWTSAREETRPGRADKARLCPPGAEASPGGT